MNRSRFNDTDLAIVLEAIAEVEGWDAQHPSVAVTRNNGWSLVEYRGIFLPKPSLTLKQHIRKVEDRIQANKGRKVGRIM